MTQPADKGRQYRAYDFDKTLSLVDTTLPFLLFRQPAPMRLLRWFHYNLTAILVKLSIWTTAMHKKHWLRTYFKNWSAEQWRAHCAAFSKTIQLHPLYHQIDWYATDSINIILTASAVDWVQPLFPPEVLVYGSEVHFGPEGLAGLHQELSGTKKLEPLRALGIQSLEAFYTDHANDRPVAAIAKSIFLVKGKTVLPCTDLAMFDRLTSKA